jgi:hypothetical protein
MTDELREIAQDFLAQIRDHIVDSGDIYLGRQEFTDITTLALDEQPGPGDPLVVLRDQTDWDAVYDVHVTVTVRRADAGGTVHTGQTAVTA